MGYWVQIRDPLARSGEITCMTMFDLIITQCALVFHNSRPIIENSVDSGQLASHESLNSQSSGGTRMMSSVCFDTILQ